MADMSPGIGFLADQAILYGSPDGEAVNDLFRSPLKIEQTDKIPASHFIARLKAHRLMKSNLKKTRIAIKYLRRFQAQKFILDAIEKNSNTYGDSIKVGSKLSVGDIQKKITEDNTSSLVSYESDNIFKYSKWVEFKTKVSRNIWEKLYIARFRLKSYRKYNKKSKRDLHLMDVNREIDVHKKKLRGHLFHNFNISAINWGRIKKEDNYKGIFPDSEDVRYVSSIVNANNVTSVNNNIDTQNSNEEVTENVKHHVIDNTKVNNVSIPTVNNSTKQDNIETSKTEPVKNENEMITAKNININNIPTTVVKKASKVKLKKTSINSKKKSELNAMINDYNSNNNVHVVTNSNKTR